MGRRRQAALVLTALACAGLARAGDGATLPRAARWLPVDRQVHALAFEPTECLPKIQDPGELQRIEIGRAAFRTPLLLGGQAARAGLSCNGCHRNGRGNPDFQFPGLSGAPGTADVTSSLMSSHRGDGIDNPKPIPDLSGPRTALKVSRDPADRQLEHFIHGLITQEFDGPEPSPETLADVATYVRNLSPEGCPVPKERRIEAGNFAWEARLAVQAAQYALDAHDRIAARLMIASARSQLGLIDERYTVPGLERDRDALRAADVSLAAIQDGIDAGAKDVPLRLTAWLATTPRWEKQVDRDQGRSLFDPAVLADALRDHAVHAGQ